MARKIIPVGTVFGRLTVIEAGEPIDVGKTGYQCSSSVCVCKCGNKTTVRNNSLVCSSTRSCGCLHRDATAAKAIHGHNRQHGKRTSEYNSWACMISRVTNPNNPRWEHYGGRGITVCERWRDFSVFIADMGEKPEPKFEYSIERENVNGHYDAGNCSWATNAEQQLNRTNNRLLTFYGKTLTLHEWSAISQISEKSISSRLSSGWPEKYAVWAPANSRLRTLLKSASASCES